MSAVSACGNYRYTLERALALAPQCWLLWVCLNPSVATGEADDPTIRRITRFTREWGYHGALVGNLYAFRATQPADLWTRHSRGEEVIGPQNDEHLNQLATRADDCIVCWGANADRDPTRVDQVKRLLRRHHELHTLGFTKGGHPVHPLRQPTSLQMQVWPA